MEASGRAESGGHAQASFFGVAWELVIGVLEEESRFGERARRWKLHHLRFVGRIFPRAAFSRVHESTLATRPSELQRRFARIMMFAHSLMREIRRPNAIG